MSDNKTVDCPYTWANGNNCPHSGTHMHQCIGKVQLPADAGQWSQKKIMRACGHHRCVCTDKP